MDLPSFAGFESDRDSFHSLLRRALQYEPLGAEEEVHAIRRLRRGDEEARAQLLQSLYRQILFTASRFWRPGISLEDLVQEGCVGALEGMEYFDEARGFRLGTFLRLYIQKRMTEHYWANTGVSNPPRTRREVIRKVRRAQEQLSQELGRDPTIREVSDRLGFPLALVDTVEGEHKCPASLDALYSGKRFRELLALGDDLWGKSTRIHDGQVLMAGVREVLGLLPEREGKAAWLLFGCDGHPPLSLRELGDHLPYSYQGLRKIHAEAMRHVHQVLMGLQPQAPLLKGRRGKSTQSQRLHQSPQAVDISRSAD